MPAISPIAVIHCNPTVKIPPDGQVFPLTNPNAHLACFPISAPTQPTPTVVVTNQFGSATLIPSQPNLLASRRGRASLARPGRPPRRRLASTTSPATR